MSGQPWQNRPSLIACWNHETVGTDLTGGLVQTLETSMDNVLLVQVPACIPRACRLTRVCVHYYYESTAASGFVLNFLRSTDCAAQFFPTLVEFDIGSGGFTPNCFCGDINVPLDRCDVWYMNFTLFGTVFPLFRTILHFELQ